MFINTTSATPTTASFMSPIFFFLLFMSRASFDRTCFDMAMGRPTRVGNERAQLCCADMRCFVFGFFRMCLQLTARVGLYAQSTALERCHIRTVGVYGFELFESFERAACGRGKNPTNASRRANLPKHSPCYTCCWQCRRAGALIKKPAGHSMHEFPEANVRTPEHVRTHARLEFTGSRVRRYPEGHFQHFP